MVLESIPVLSTAYLSILLGIVLLISGYYYRSRKRSKYILGSGAVLLILGVLLILYFISSFG
ncbi:MAG: uncharacterized membrane protein HdeD (DUF308 family) [Candidatus Nanohaloarchaea archaeon]|jgi:uncharacterized membrane protein HdeD (DUF308 family)